ncbi:MAG: Arm DNA-binding domain-containing protein [Campylobacteraceae bacterium]|jgi:hypothetical protein|nr:Arm DNA-binding domain-containing protein [Campylobacteraceae bacterium]
MPKIAKPLTDTQIKNAKTKNKNYKLFDGGGMFLLIKISGKKYWRLNYTYNGKQQTMSLGIYPQTSLQEARIKRDEYKKILSLGDNPSIQKKRSTDIKTVKQAVIEWYELNKERFSDSYKKNISIFINRRIIPSIGEMPITKVIAADVIAFGKK